MARVDLSGSGSECIGCPQGVPGVKQQPMRAAACKRYVNGFSRRRHVDGERNRHGFMGESNCLTFSDAECFSRKKELSLFDQQVPASVRVASRLELRRSRRVELHFGSMDGVA